MVLTFKLCNNTAFRESVEQSMELFSRDNLSDLIFAQVMFCGFRGFWPLFPKYSLHEIS